MTTPFWALTAAYWLHMAATVVWIGGFAAAAFLVLPARERYGEDVEARREVERLRRRIDGLGWMSAAALLATGLVQMSASPHYEGFLSVGNRWSGAILLKHMLFLVMVGANAYLTWGIGPALERSAMLRGRGVEATGWEELLRRERKLITFNMVLGVLVLGLTAVARAS